MTLFRSVFVIAFFTSVSRIVGFIRDILIARFIGVSYLSDVFFAAFRLPNFFRRIFAEGAFNSSFVPIFIKKMEDDGGNTKGKALEFARNIFSIMFFVLLILIIVLEIFMPLVVRGMFPGFRPGTEEFILLVHLCRITIIYLLFISLFSLFAGMLNSVGKFAITSAGPIILNIALIASLYLFTDLVKNVAYALSWGIFVAGILQFSWLLYFVIKTKMFVRPEMPKLDDDTRKFFRKLLPGIIGANAMQINLLVDTMIASLISGAISCLYYADRINQLPLAMIGIAISVALLPSLSNKIKDNKHNEAIKLQNIALEASLILVIPAMLALNFLSFEIISSLFQRGQFDAHDTEKVSKALAFYSLGLPSYVLVKVLEPSFFSRGNTKTPMQIALFCVALNVLLNLIFYKLHFGYIGIIMASVISSYTNLTLMLTKLIKNDYFHFEKGFVKKLLQIFGASGIMLAVLLLLRNYFAHSDHFRPVVELIIIILSGLLVYLGVSYLTGNIKFLLKNLKPGKEWQNHSLE